MQGESVNARLARGEIVAAGHKLYAQCRQCGEIVQLNKPLIGSLHLCAPTTPAPVPMEQEGSE